jgi:hypothetical protein
MDLQALQEAERIKREEMQRKKEHSNFATNFEKARGFVRTNWKSKNFNPSENPCELDSSTDDS